MQGMCLKSSSQLALEPALNLLCAHSMLTNAYTCELYLPKTLSSTSARPQPTLGAKPRAVRT